MTRCSPRSWGLSRSYAARNGRRGIRLLLVLAGLTLTVAWAAASPAGAIVGGTTTPESAHPQIVELPSCTGSLIAPDRVLTAAHCLDTIVQGATDVEIAGAAYRIAHVARHPRYTYEQHRLTDPIPYASPYDAALLQLDHAVPGVVPLRLRTAIVPSNRRARIIGFGQNHPQAGSGEFGTLRTASVVTRSTTRCRSSLRRADPGLAAIYKPGKHICAQDPDGRAPYRSICDGDSGSPLLLAGKHSMEIAGITATSADCGASDNDPSVFDSIVSVHAFVTAPIPTWFPTPVGTPHVDGTPRDGQQLTCVEPAWEPTQPTSVRFSWDRSDHKSYTAGQHRSIEPADVGKKMRCIVEAGMPGGGTVNFNSPAVAVAAAG